MLTDQDVETLESILFAPGQSDEALDVFGLHGVVTASVVGPVPLSIERIYAIATGQPESGGDAMPDEFQTLVARLARTVQQELEQGHTLELPEPEDEETSEEALENWCAGFTDTFLLDEDQWLGEDEETVGEMMTPILTLSNLFDDEAFQQARKDPKRLADYADAIPELLSDLYLHYHSP
ncbi:YecA family protein [Salicola sp. Rm-C-2C1-2]|uniref:YecA/YgfB family protein n=1 Tax=Salicola sp. Rm-C-2C1-2 TaxID=3141321 RepID=UPI0032E409A0